MQSREGRIIKYRDNPVIVQVVWWNSVPHTLITNDPTPDNTINCRAWTVPSYGMRGKDMPYLLVRVPYKRLYIFGLYYVYVREYYI